MDISTNSSHVFLRFLLRTCVIANDIYLPLHQWIITPSKPADARIARMMPSQFPTAIAYAIAEPLCTKFLIWLSAMPWSVTIAISPTYMGICYCGFIAIAKTLDDAVRAAKEEQQPKPGERVLIENSHQASLHILLWLSLPLVTAAFLNAELLLQTQSLAAAAMHTAWYFYMGWFGVSLYILGSGFAGLLLSKRLWKPLGPRAGSGRGWVSALILVLAIKVALRKVLGLDPLMPFSTSSGEQGEALWGDQRYQWIAAHQADLPWRASLGPSVFAIVCTFVGVWFMDKGGDDQKQLSDRLLLAS